MTFGRRALASTLLALAGAAACDRSSGEEFVREHAPIIALTHARVIDGTGSASKTDQTLIIQDARIRVVNDAPLVAIPANARVLDLHGRTLLPGLVGMHEHLFYQLRAPGSDELAVRAQASFAKLYLASGVTTIRTAGTIDLSGDLRIKRLIDEGRVPGPKIHVTGPYLNASARDPDPDGIAQEVAAQADQGATSFKAYTTLRTAELRAAIRAAHDRGLTITGHLCAVGFGEAAAMGIDNLEHGLPVDTEFFSGKQSDQCPPQGEVVGELARMDITDAGIQQTIRELVRHHVAITSTLAVFETFTARDAVLDSRVPDLLSSRLQAPYRAARAHWNDRTNPWVPWWDLMVKKEQQFERAFVAAGGRLMAGVDPTGWGGLVAGFGDQREVELLVEGGLTPERAIEVATANGAAFLGEQSTIGTLTAGKQADVVVVRGNPAALIGDLRNVELVFKDGVAYDPAVLIATSRGTLGAFEIRSVLSWPLNALVPVVMLLAGRLVWRRVRAIRHARNYRFP